MKPKTDSEILDYIADNEVKIMPPVSDGDYWRARLGEGRIYRAGSLRDVVLMVAYDNNTEDVMEDAQWRRLLKQ